MLLVGQMKRELIIVIAFNNIKVLHNHDENSFVTREGLRENRKKSFSRSLR